MRWRLRVRLLACACCLTLAAGLVSALAVHRIRRLAVRAPGSPSGGTTYLLIGSDSRSFVPAAQRTMFGTAQESPGDHADIILLLRVGPDGTAKLLEVPRDVLIQLPNGAPVRITLTMATGAQGPVDALCRTLGIGVDHVVVVHFDGLERIINSVGGVTVNLPGPLRDPFSDLSIDRGGPNHLDGTQALALIRARSVVQLEGGVWVADAATADERSTQARAVLQALAPRLKVSLGAPVTSIREAWEVAGAVSVDAGMDTAAMIKLVAALRHLPTTPTVTLDVAFHPGPVPIADLLPADGGIVAAFNGGTGGHCSFLPIPPAEGT